MSFSDLAAVCDAAIAGYGLASLQEYLVDAPIKRGELVAVLEKFKPQLEPAWLVWRASPLNAGALRADGQPRPTNDA